MLKITTICISRSYRRFAVWLVLPIFAAVLCPALRSADKEDKEKKKEEKKEKSEPWVEIRTAHFVVASDGGDKTARHVGNEFEQLIRVFQTTMPGARVTNGIPIQILAARGPESFAKLFPEFPANNKHREQPPGLFLSGQEKTYIAIRTNVSGPVPYEEIFQNYARMVLKLSYRSLPPWLEEGYSNVYGSMAFTDKGVRIGRTDPDDLSVLFESPLLPLDLVLHVDRSSPYYSGGNKNTVYSAESRALVHFLLTDPQIVASKALDRYVADVEHGADALQAARQAFGDLNQLQTNLDAYIRAIKPPPSDITVAGVVDMGGPQRTLSAAEVEARLGEFAIARGRRDDGQSKLEEALTQEPTLAEAEQQLGFVLLRQNQLDEADKHFSRAIELNPNDGLSYYGQGMVAMSRGGFVGAPVGAVAALEKSVELNPDFAPAWNNLALIYSSRADTMQKALTDAQHAASLAPGDSSYQLQIAAIQERLGRSDDARKTAMSVQASSSDRETSNRAGDLIARASKPATTTSSATISPTSPPPPPAGVPGNTPTKSSSDSGLRIERKTEPDDKPASTVSATSAPRTESTSPPPPMPTAAPSSATGRVYSMVGAITEVICTTAPEVRITLKAQTIVMKLHADDLGKVSFQAAGSAASGKSSSCAALRGRSARVSYTLASDRPWDGEIKSVEFR